MKLLIIIIVVVLILAGGGGGAALYFSTRPQPVISLSSKYHQNNALVGASSTTFQLTGHKFSGSSAISFLLDGKLAPGATSARSDSNGNVTAILTVTDAWSVGNHTLTAKDASGYLTKTGAQIVIVTPGQASTPGPNGAPTDSASGTVVATTMVNGQPGTPETLTVTGSPNGGTVCGPLDDGKPHKESGSSSGLNITITIVLSCSGTYKGGNLTYTETATSYKLAFDNGISCQTNKPFVKQRLEGKFTNASAVSGSYSTDTITVECNLGVGSQSFPAEQGTWTGLAVMQ